MSKKDLETKKDKGSDDAACSGFFIVNRYDRPDERFIAERRDDGKFYYVHPSIRDEKLYHGMTPSDPTPLENFGISACVIDGELRGCQNRESVATYTDGRKRRWQGQGLFSFRLQNDEHIHH